MGCLPGQNRPEPVPRTREPAPKVAHDLLFESGIDPAVHDPVVAVEALRIDLE